MKSICPIRQINYDDEEKISKNSDDPSSRTNQVGMTSRISCDVATVVGSWWWRGWGGQVVERMSLEIHAPRWSPSGLFVFRKHQHY